MAAELRLQFKGIISGSSSFGILSEITDHLESTALELSPSQRLHLAFVVVEGGEHSEGIRCASIEIVHAAACEISANRPHRTWLHLKCCIA
ncbi:hypothetical protein AWL63_20495 [Sphingomonas panacis]|uniref:Uncharacterized protein n=1 Tax=Sphingomonas panacis TaxID=1560345 RepID=A0A1B3ZEY7_9SPHN|nr:hypothetical protein AWL63_20495 [Sphingomonas panacis]